MAVYAVAISLKVRGLQVGRTSHHWESFESQSMQLPTIYYSQCWYNSFNAALAFSVYVNLCIWPRYIVIYAIAAMVALELLGLSWGYLWATWGCAGMF